MKRFFLAIMATIMCMAAAGCDGGTSSDKLLKTLAENSWFCDDDNSSYLGFDAEKKTVMQTIAQTSFYLEGPITEVRQTGEKSFEIDLTHEARHDEEMDYDAFNETLKIEYDIKKPNDLYVSFVRNGKEDGPYHLHSDKGLGEDKLLQLLEANGPYANYEDFIIAIFDSKAKTVTDRRISNYETPVDETAPIKSVVYKGFNQYDITLETPEGSIVMPIYFEENDPDHFYINAYEQTYYETDHEMDAAQLLDFLVGGNIYEDEFHEITVIFDNSMGIIRVNNSNIDHSLHEYGILSAEYKGCNYYYYLLSDMASGVKYDMRIRLHSYDHNIGMIFKEADIIDMTLYGGND